MVELLTGARGWERHPSEIIAFPPADPAKVAAVALVDSPDALLATVFVALLDLYEGAIDDQVMPVAQASVDRLRVLLRRSGCRRCDGC